MNSCELISLSAAISCGIAKSVPEEELPLIAALFGQIGATLATILVNEEINNKETVTPEVVPPDTEIITEPVGT